ncbi:MAG: TRAP transporter large permease [Clostridiales Family XIII bacterium]|jgi:tripartite ATP-independent transporter DctM subunit|nr:TRAP transporter large permease [Clostridiales Family XIII bacterium]
MEFSPFLIGVLGVVLLLVVMFLRMWVGVSMMVISFLGCWVLTGKFESAYQVLGSVPYSQVASYTMVCMPLFILMGTFLSHSDIGADLYLFVRKCLGHIRGGLAMATVGACGLFAAICGESTATAVTMGKIAYPEMLKFGYSKSLASCCIVCGGTIGILIPPSVIMIIYGVLVEESIGRLFIAGIVPGILQVLFYMITIWIMCKMKPDIAPAADKYPMKDRLASAKSVWPAGLLFLLIIAGIYGGFFTPTEAGGLGAAIALVIVIGLRRFSIKFFKDATADALQASTMIFCLLIGAYLFMRFTALSGMPNTLSKMLIEFKNAHNMSPIAVIAVIMIVYFILGMFLDSMAVLLLTVPIIYPIVIGMGFDGIWWGIMMVRFIEMSMISPPFGLNLFVMSKSIDTSLGVLYKGVWPYLIADTVHVVLLMAFPQIVTFLPNLM